jgi:putative transposase
VVGESRSNNTVVYRCTAPVAWCPKYRRKVIGGRVEQRLKEIITAVCAEHGATLDVVKRYVEDQHGT